MTSSEHQTPQPQIIDYKVATFVDPEAAGKTLQTLGMSPEAITNSSVHVKHADPFSRLRRLNGMTRPNWLSRLVDGRRDWNQGKGSVIKLFPETGDEDRSLEDMNKTFVHEGEHAAQIERNDPRLLGELAIYGGTLIAGLTTNHLLREKSPLVRLAASLVGAVMVQQAIYTVAAPHETQARERAKMLLTDAVRRPDQASQA